MSAAWPKVRLEAVLNSVERASSPQPGTEYRQLGVRLWGEGAYERESMDGAATKYARLYRASVDDVVVNKIWARNGSVAVVPKSLDGCWVSGEFPLFECDRGKLFPQWMHWLSKTQGFWAQCDEKAQGTSGKNRIKPSEFLGIEIPLPPLAEQQRIVARIEALAGQVREAQGLRRESADKSAVLVSRTTATLLDNAGWPLLPLENILTENPRNGLSPKPEIESGGRPMLRINAVSSSPTRFVDLTAAKLVDVSDSDAEPFVLRDEDVFIVRYNGDINRVAKPAIYKAKGDCKAVFPDKLMRLRPKHAIMLPDFLVFALNASSVRAQIEELGKTTAGNIGISGGDVKGFVVPVPSIPEQRRIVAELDALQAQVSTLKHAQAETAAELDALLPAILAKAFRGAL